MLLCRRTAFRLVIKCRGYGTACDQQYSLNSCNHRYQCVERIVALNVRPTFPHVASVLEVYSRCLSPPSVPLFMGHERYWRWDFQNHKFLLNYPQLSGRDAPSQAVRGFWVLGDTDSCLSSFQRVPRRRSFVREYLHSPHTVGKYPHAPGRD